VHLQSLIGVIELLSILQVSFLYLDVKVDLGNYCEIDEQEVIELVVVPT
jgi:hypothetical protein